MILSGFFIFSLPLTNPVLKFLIILMVILFTPILFNKIKIPHILGLIIAGALIGPNGFNLLLRDSGIILSGTAGLLYIMFLAGLEIDLSEFKKNSPKSLLFGFFTFSIPMLLGTITSVFVLNLTLSSSLLVASMYASHTLIAYPILSRLGLTKNRAVNITIGGTLITDVLALLVLAVIVGMAKGEVDTLFWFKLSVSILIFSSVVLFLFPMAGRWFLKKYDDKVSQYIFVLAMVFLGAALSEAAGIEAIIGAFFTGLALNKLIPATSPLMNRVEFVGNALFIPFFLISVGMLVDYRAFFQDGETIKVALVMTITATSAKFLAAWLTQKSLKFNANERRVIFGLSNAQAAATLAAVIVGYNTIVGQTPDGESIRLLDESILNGTIVMILITCTIASIYAEKGGQGILMAETPYRNRNDAEADEKIMVLVNNPDTLDELINFSLVLKSKKNKDALYALHVISNDAKESTLNATKLLDKAVFLASASDIILNKLMRYSANIANACKEVIEDQQITDLVMGLHVKNKISEPFLGNLTESILKCNTTVYVYKPVQPISTVRRHVVFIPENAEKEVGFPFWIARLWNIVKNTGTTILFYGKETALMEIRTIHVNYPISAEFKLFESWNDFILISKEIKEDDIIHFVMSRPLNKSFHPNMTNIPSYLTKYFKANSFLLIYPIQASLSDHTLTDLKNPSLLEPLEKLDEISKNLAKLFKRL